MRWAPKARQVLEKIQDTLQAGESVADADYDDLARGLLGYDQEQNELRCPEGVSVFGAKTTHPLTPCHGLAVVAATIDGDHYAPPPPSSPAPPSNKLRPLGKRQGVTVLIPYAALRTEQIDIHPTPDACNFGPAKAAHYDLQPPCKRELSDWTRTVTAMVVDAVATAKASGCWYVIKYPTDLKASPKAISFVDLVLVAWSWCVDAYGKPGSTDASAPTNWPWGEVQLKRFTYMRSLMEQSRAAIVAEDERKQLEAAKKTQSRQK